MYKPEQFPLKILNFKDAVERDEFLHQAAIEDINRHRYSIIQLHCAELITTGQYNKLIYNLLIYAQNRGVVFSLPPDIFAENNKKYLGKLKEYVDKYAEYVKNYAN
jgi:hypothetical protein